MTIKWMSLFYLLFVMAACVPIAPIDQGKTEPVRSRDVFLKERIELKHGQSYEEWRKGLPAYWH